MPIKGAFPLPSATRRSSPLSNTAVSVDSPSPGAHGLSAIRRARTATYYVDATLGNDSNPGTQALPWQTLAKVNAAALQPGDTVLLKRGSVWRETLTITRSGTLAQPIIFSAYGSGARPQIRRCDPHTTWASYYDNGTIKIWSATTASPYVRAAVHNGVRRASVYQDTGQQPEVIIPSDQAGCHRAGTFYYRNDAGSPTNIEIGRRTYGIHINGAQYIIIDSIDVFGTGATTSSTIFGSGIYTTTNSAYVTVRNCELSHSESFAINDGVEATPSTGATGLAYINLDCHDCMSSALYMRGSGTITNCKSYDNGRLAGDYGDRGGIGIQGSVAIDGCEVYNLGLANNTHDAGISIFEPTGPCSVRNCYIHDITGGALQIHGNTYYTGKHAVTNNVIDTYSTTSDATGAAGKVAGIRLQYVSAVDVFNNVIAYGGNNANSAGIFLRYTATNVLIKNNIFFQRAQAAYDIYGYFGATLTGLEINYNIYNKASYTNNWSHGGNNYSTLAAWTTAKGFDANSSTVDPLFVDPANGNFQLQIGSPARLAGVNVGLPFAGAAPNIGAY